MKQITKREKAVLSIGALSAVAVFVWFVLLPMLQSEGPKEKSSLEVMQERLEAVHKLASMSSILVDLEESIVEQSGYKKADFKRGSANPAMIRYIAKAAQEAGIGEIEQLDARPETSRRKQTRTVSRQDVLGTIIDGMYMRQVRDEMKQAASDEDTTENKSSEEAENQDSDSPDESEVKQTEEPSEPESSKEAENVEKAGQESDSPAKDEDDQSEKPAEVEQTKQDSDSPDGNEDEQVKEQTDTDAPEDTETDEPAEKVEEAKSTGTVFPPFPRGEDISDELRQSLGKAIESRQGKTLALEDISGILDEVGLLEGERPGVSRRLQRYSDGVRKKKSEIRQSFGKLGISPSAMTGQSELFKITELSLENLRSDGVSESVLKKLANMRSYELASERDFISAVGKEIGKGSATKYKSLILKHARKTEIFSIKMVFKGKMDQLVKFMYNIQDSARWLKINSMRIGISDRKETVLSVELSMTATALYDL